MTAANNGTGTTMLAQHPPFHGGKSMQTLLRWHEQQEQPQENSTTKKNDHPAADTFEQELQQHLFAPATRTLSQSSHSDSDSDNEEQEDRNKSQRWYGEEILPPPQFDIEGPLMGFIPTSGDAVEAIAVTIDGTDEEHFIFTGLDEDFLFVAARQHTEDEDDNEETRNEQEHKAPQEVEAAPQAVSACSSSSLRCRVGSNPEDKEQQQQDPKPKRRKISMEEGHEEAETLEAASTPPSPSRFFSSSSTRSTTTQDDRNYIGE